MTMLPQELPADLGGYQHVENGDTKPGDIWVQYGKPQAFLNTDIYKTVEHANSSLPGWNVYRLIPQPGHHQPEVVRMLAEHGLKPSGSLSPVGATSLAEDQININFIPQDDASRKAAPMFRGLLAYFPAALFSVASHSYESDRKHNPDAVDGPYWARGKSSDHADCIVRHLIDAGEKGTKNRRYHLRALAWRSLALLQEEEEAMGASPGTRSKF